MANFLGQHFLKNDGVIKKIIAAVDLQAGETIIEVGPGHGELTIPLAAACEKVGAKIIAIEKDERLMGTLKIKFEAGDAPIEIIHADILEFFKTALSGASGQHTSTHSLPSSFKIVGNIPYYLTGHLLRIVSELETKPERAVIMIQKEVAERITAVPPRMNRLAASVQFWAEPKIIASVPRGDFTPPPEVDSAVIALETKKRRGGKSDSAHSEVTAEQYYKIVRTVFAQPRKTILNNLSAATRTKDEAMTILEKLGIDPKSRPQDLAIEKIMAIAQHFSSVHK